MTNHIRPNFKDLLPKREKNAHKGTCGRVGIVAGSSSMLGAAVLTAKGALLSGAGLVCLMTVKDAIPLINIQIPELIVLPLPTRQGYLADTTGSDVARYVKEFRMNVVAMGPGLGKATETATMVRNLIKKIFPKFGVNLVLDADGLNALVAKDLKSLAQHQAVLTPHHGEFEKMFGLPKEANRQNLTQNASVLCGQIVLLKGNETAISDGKKIFINPSGNEALATAGSGDVLTGIIAGLMGQGLSGFDAAVLGAYLHGLCANLGAKDLGIYSFTASSILNYLPKAFLHLQKLNFQQQYEVQN